MERLQQNQEEAKNPISQINILFSHNQRWLSMSAEGGACPPKVDEFEKGDSRFKFVSKPKGGHIAPSPFSPGARRNQRCLSLGRRRSLSPEGG